MTILFIGLWYGWFYVFDMEHFWWKAPTLILWFIANVFLGFLNVGSWAWAIEYRNIKRKSDMLKNGK